MSLQRRRNNYLVYKAMKITHHLSRFSTFFKGSSLFVQSLIIVTAIGVIAGTATVAAMVATPTDNETSQITSNSEVESSITGDTVTEDNQPIANNEQQQDTSTDSSQTNTQTGSTPTTTQQQSQPEPQPQPKPKPEPTYTDTYPSKWASKPINSVIDDWGMSNRQSVSYTAWKVNEKYSNMPNFGGCNANQWVQCAEDRSIVTGTTAKAHSVGIINNFSVWVEAVSSNKVTVSFYNWGNTGEYGLWKDVPASNFTHYIYFGN